MAYGLHASCIHKAPVGVKQPRNALPTFPQPPTNTSKTDSVYDALKHEITHFRVRPGERLLEQQLSARFGISRTPIREALQRLERDGHVVSVAGGRIVKLPDEAGFEDIYSVRLALERLAVAQACERAPDRGVIALRESWQAPRVPDPDFGAYRTADERFHIGIARLTRNEMLIAQLDGINDRISVLRQADYEEPGRLESIRKDHEAILDAIQRREADLAIRLIEAHIEEAKSNIRRLLFDALAAAGDGSLG